MLNSSGCRPARCSVYIRALLPCSLDRLNWPVQTHRQHARTHALAVLDSPQSVTQSRSQADRFHRGGRGGAKKPGSKDDDKVVCFT